MTSALLSLIAGGVASHSVSAAPPTAQTIVDRAIQAMGGAERLASIRTLKLSTVGHTYEVEQSERPTGPYVTTYTRGERTYDFDALTETGTEGMTGLIMGPKEFTRAVSSGRGTPRGLSAELARRLLLGPERVLLLARKATDLHRLPDKTYQGAPHHVLSFRWGSTPVRVLINTGTAMPTAVQTTEQRSDFWEIWGDVETTTSWGNWSLLPRGVWQPMQATTERNGLVVWDQTTVQAAVTLGPGEPVDLTPPKAAMRDVTAMAAQYKAVPVGNGVIQYQGPYNLSVVEQPDGLVVFEPVISSAFSSAILDRLAKEFPGKRVKAVVATDDAWPHFGGLRTYVAQGIEIIVLEANRPITERLIRAPRTILPDELALKPVKAKIRTVSGSMTIGTGERRFTLYPVAGEASERMLMAYFPAQRLLYGTDLLQRTKTGFFFPAYPQELRNAVERERLPVEKVFGEHLPVTPWSVVTGFLDELNATK